jgi:glyoxylase-like metal-dependent hydrolase (beta-lactamase superfamily II)
MLEVERVEYPGLDPRLRVYRCDEVSVDSFAVLTERFVVILDTLISREMMREVVDDLEPEVSNRRLLVVDTHGDWDHVWGNGLFAGPHTERHEPIMVE